MESPLSRLGACIGCALLLSSSAFAANELACLNFEPIPITSNGELSATVSNTCEKAVTAYTISVTLLHPDGTSTLRQGAGQDFLAGMAAEPGGGVGAILPGEQRRLYLTMLQQSDLKEKIDRTLVQAQSIIFDDATAVGDEQRIRFTFKERQYQLGEWSFWNESLGKYKGPVSDRGSMVSLVELSGVQARVRTMSVPGHALLVQTRADGMRVMLQALDKTVESGQRSQADAIRWLEQYLGTMVDNYQKNSERRR